MKTVTLRSLVVLSLSLCCLCIVTTACGGREEPRTSKEPEGGKTVEPLKLEKDELHISGGDSYQTISIDGGVPPYTLSEMPEKLKERMTQLYVNAPSAAGGQSWAVVALWRGPNGISTQKGYAGSYPMTVTDSQGQKVKFTIRAHNYYAFSDMYSGKITKEGDVRRLTLDVLDFSKHDKEMQESRVFPFYWYINTDDFDIQVQDPSHIEYVSHQRVGIGSYEVRFRVREKGASKIVFLDKETGEKFPFIVDIKEVK